MEKVVILNPPQADEESRPSIGVRDSPVTSFSQNDVTSQTILHFCLCILFLFLIGCASSTPRFKASSAKEISEERTENNISVDIDEAIPEIVKSAKEDTVMNRVRMLDEMLAMLGTPYNYSGTNETGNHH